MSDKNNNAREMTETQKNIYRQKIDMAMAGTDTTKKRRSAIAIMGSLIGLVKPLLHIMAAAVILGTVGYLCAIFLTILAGQVILRGLAGNAAGAGISVISGTVMKSTWFSGVSVNRILAVMILIAVLRGIFHYMEQYCNHFIAFKLLAIIRHKVFAALTSVIMVVFIGRIHVLAGVLALAAYLIVGVVIPMWNGKRGSQKGMEFRTEFGELNSFVLDSLRGLDETIQYDQGEKRKGQMSDRSRKLAGMQEELSRMEGSQRSFTNLMILFASFGMLALTIHLYGKGEIGFDGILTCTIAMMGSFGPVVALSSLSNNLNQTLASGERVLSLLEEKPLVEEIPWEQNSRVYGGNAADSREKATEGYGFSGAEAAHVTFAYEDETILNDYSLKLAPGKITGIHGASGSGKSTLLKLLMRFWDVNKGTISVDHKDVREILTRHLRDMESYVTQETHLFHDSIANNIAIAKPGATREEIMAAAKKASIHDFIMTLPKGYDTEVGELGDTLSGGEKQRIGIARAFLHDSPFLLLDEPTSNLDSLNEGIILKSLKEDNTSRTVVLVSHRTSTMNVADVVYEMENGRVS